MVKPTIRNMLEFVFTEKNNKTTQVLNNLLNVVILGFISTQFNCFLL